MRLTLIGPVYPYRGGIAWFTTSLGSKLISAGHQVQVISFSRQYPAWLYPGKSDKDPSQQHIEIPAQYLLDPLYPPTWRRAVRQIRQFEPQMVIIQWWTTFWAPAFWAISKALGKVGIPVAFVIHNVMPHEARFFDRFLVRTALKQGNVLIHLSPQEGERLSQLLPKSHLVSARLPLFDIAGERIDRKEARQQLNLSEQDLVLLFFGLVRPYKGLEILIKALGSLRQEGITPILLVVGEFWENPQKYLDLIHEHALSDQVRIVNRFVPNEEVAVYFSAADAFVAPYVGGTQSASIKVAMSFQLPILASDRIVSDLPQDRYPMLVHPAGDSKALASSISTLMRESRPCITQSDPADSWEEIIRLLESLCQIRGKAWRAS